MTYNKLPQTIFNAISENVQQLAALFPAAVKDGQVDFAALREELGQFEEVTAEKYELTWAGKQASKKAAQTDIAGRTLKYVPEDSKNPDTTENLYIDGDNLEVLKLLRQNYYGAIKMIYIDPPYNTGNDFVYRDDFTQSKVQSDEDEGETVDGERMIVNQKSSNRFHATWINMMYPRLRVAKDLLRNDGVIFISIDDNEVAQLRKLCDEVFGENNFLCLFTWKRRTGSNDAVNNISTDHEYILCYAKSSEVKFNGVKKEFEKYSNPDNDPRGDWARDNLTCNKTASERPNLAYPITDPTTGITYQFNPNRVWAYERSRMEQVIADGKVLFPKDGKGTPMYKRHKAEVRSDAKPFSSILDTQINAMATKEVQELFDSQVFNYPKTVDLIKQLIYQATSPDSTDIILDFFSGSATAAHAVMQLNAEDNGSRKFIAVQYPEKTDNTEYPTICEIGKERIRRAGEKIKAEVESANQQLKLGEEPKALPDIGFRVFRTADTNIRWTHEALKDGQMELDESMLSDKEKLDFMPGFTDIDVVYEVLLRQRDIPLSAKVERTSIGTRTYLFADAYIVCLDDDVTRDMVEQLAAIEPTPIKYVFRDSAFNDDISLKDETVRRLSAYIARNSGENKRTYTVEFI